MPKLISLAIAGNTLIANIPATIIFFNIIFPFMSWLMN
jgi:hypothetical protein